MLLLPVLAVLSAAPASPTAVVLVTQRSEVSDKDAMALALEAQRQLTAAGVRVEPTANALKQLAKLSFVDTSTCAGRKVCVSELGRMLKVEVVVGLSVADLDEDRAISVEALRISDGVVVAREQLVFPRKKAMPAKALQAFAAALLAPALPAVQEPTPPIAVDAPLLLPPPPPPPALTPTPPPAEPVLVAPVTRTRTLPIVALSAAGAATVAGVVLLAVHLVNRNALTPATLTYPEAQAIAARANVTLVGAAACAGLAAALGTTALVTW